VLTGGRIDGREKGRRKLLCVRQSRGIDGYFYFMLILLENSKKIFTKNR
jgi:hypothetical protein